MSYGITIKSRGGQVEVTGHYGDVPDGTHEVTGHDGAPIQAAGGATSRERNISVTRLDADDRKVIAAQHFDTAWS